MFTSKKLKCVARESRKPEDPSHHTLKTLFHFYDFLFKLFFQFIKSCFCIRNRQAFASWGLYFMIWGKFLHLAMQKWIFFPQGYVIQAILRTVAYGLQSCQKVGVKILNISLMPSIHLISFYKLLPLQAGLQFGLSSVIICDNL